jgi:DNA mismatch repair protein MSH5
MNLCVEALLTFPLAGDHPPPPYRVDYRPNPEFSYEGAKNKLINLLSIPIGEEGVRFLIPGDSPTHGDSQGQDEFGSTSRQGKLIRISSWINLDSRVSLGCVGAVLTSLQRKRSAEFLQDDPDGQQAYRITSMEMFSMQGKMYVSVNTMLLPLTLSQVYQCRHVALPPDHPSRASP